MAVHRRTRNNDVRDMAYLVDVKITSPTTKKLAKRSKATATKQSIACGSVRCKAPILCVEFYIPTIRLRLLHYSPLDDFGVTTATQSGNCKLIDRNNQNKVLRMIPKRKSNELFCRSNNGL